MTAAVTHMKTAQISLVLAIKIKLLDSVIKAIVYTEMKLLPSFPHSCVISNPYRIIIFTLLLSSQWRFIVITVEMWMRFSVNNNTKCSLTLHVFNTNRLS